MKFEPRRDPQALLGLQRTTIPTEQHTTPMEETSVLRY